MLVRQFKVEEATKSSTLEWDAFDYWLLSYCLLVSDSEKFIIKTCHPFMASLQDENLKQQLRTCFSQEAQHAKSHEIFAKMIFKEHTWMKYYIALSRFINYELLSSILPERFKLAIAAATEQLNCAISTYGLRDQKTFYGQSEFYKMLKWHFVEEIEHREVVFDLMENQKIGFVSRFLAMALTLSSFVMWISLGGLLLSRNFRQFSKVGMVIKEMNTSASRFLGKSYHPSQDPLEHSFFEMQKQLT